MATAFSLHRSLRELTPMLMPNAAVPLTVFTLDYCIRYPAASVTDVAARELATVERSIDEDDLVYESRFDRLIDQDQVAPEPSLLRQQR